MCLGLRREQVDLKKEDNNSWNSVIRVPAMTWKDKSLLLRIKFLAGSWFLLIHVSFFSRFSKFKVFKTL